MTVGIHGPDGTIVKADGIHDALRVSIRPSDVAGAYRLAATNGTGIAAGAGADSEIFAFRNPSDTKVAVVRRILLSMHTGATGFTAGISLFYVKFARSFSAPPTDGTTITLTGDNCALATDYPAPACAAYINDDSVLTSGTETADSTAFGRLPVATSNGTNTMHVQKGVLFDAKDAAQPILLEQNEGFIIYGTVPATGVWFTTVEVEWEEYLIADYPST